MGMGDNEISNIGTLPFRYDSKTSMVKICSRKEGRKEGKLMQSVTLIKS